MCEIKKNGIKIETTLTTVLLYIEKEIVIMVSTQVSISDIQLT